ncbi:MAG: M20/M25/M40 family metallo-hydrolase [Planctomycetales bacterium]|nr:M20/M25/M40 family metallo-hydrolase [Planctomycetales bacterium]
MARRPNLEPRTFRTWLSLGLPLLAALAVAQEPGGSPASDPEAAAREAAVEKALAAITPEGMMEHVKFLASDDLKGREAGTPEGRRAADYVAARFRSAGLEPIGEQGTFFQAVKISGETQPGPDSTVSLLAGAGEKVLVPGTDFRPLGLATNPEAAGILVFAGYGISAPEAGYDDYAGLDVAGRVVLLLASVPKEADPGAPFAGRLRYVHGGIAKKAKNAADHGAAGFVLVSGPATKELDGDILTGIPFKSPIPGVQVTRRAAAELFAAAGQDLRAAQEAIEAAGKPASSALPVRARLRATTVDANTLAHNVVARLPGRDPAASSEVVVLGGHYDHVGMGTFGSRTNARGQIHNGADDNASGITGVIAVAEAMGAAGLRGRRTILFLGFAAEEKGLLGSAFYCRQPLAPLAQTVTMVNLDMIGRGANRWCAVNGVGTSPGFREMMERLNRRVGLEAVYYDGGRAPSDNDSFYMRGIPILMLFTGLHDDYHTPTDDWQKIESDTLARSARLAMLATWELAEMPERPPFRKCDGRVQDMPGMELYFKPVQRKGSYLGIREDPKEEAAAGVRVQSVVPDSPAEKAGLKAGDLLVKVGEVRVGSLRDLTAALEKHAPGSKVSVAIVRGSESLAVEVTLGRPQ